MWDIFIDFNIPKHLHQNTLLLAFLLDMLIGDPHWWPHPVRAIGHLIKWAEGFSRWILRDRYRTGILLWTIVLSVTIGSTWLVIFLSRTVGERAFIHFYGDKLGAAYGACFAELVEIYIVYTTLAAKNLADEARKVYQELRRGDLPSARKQLSGIVGRDTENLDEHECVRATVETVSENFVDGVLAPIFFALLGGPIAAMAFKAVSTLDSMVGYDNRRYKRVGWFSAKVDDVCNYIPARLAYIFVPLGAIFCWMSPLRSLIVGWRDGQKSASPNSAIGESLFAGAMGVRLGGPVSYQGKFLLKSFLGDNIRPLEPREIVRSTRLLLVCSFLSLTTAWALYYYVWVKHLKLILSGYIT